MALSLMLRSCSKLPRLSALPRCSFQIQKTAQFTQFITKKNTQNVSLASKNNTQLLNVIQQRNMSADHSKMWTVEKIVSLMLLGVVPATFIAPNNALDNLFAVLVVIHFHWGLEAVIVDYVRPIIVGNVLPKLSLLLLYIISATTLGGLLYFNHNQIGIGCAFRNFWCLTGTPEDNEGEGQ